MAKRRGRVVALGCGALLGAALLFAFGLLAAWETPAVRRWVLDRAAAFVGQRSGWAVTATDVHLSLPRGRITVEGVTVAAPGGPPLLQAKSLTICLAWRALLRSPVVLAQVEVVEPEVDLAALPSPRATKSSDPDAPLELPLEIQALRVSKGRVVGVPVPKAAAPWVRGVRLEGVGFQGSLGKGTLSGTLAVARLAVEKTMSSEAVFSLKAQLEASTAGQWKIATLELEGPGVLARAADLEPAPGPLGFSGSAELSANLDALLPESGLRGQVGAQLGLPAGGQGGNVALEVRRLALTPVVPAALSEELGLAGATLDLAASGEFSFGPGQGVAATGHVTVHAVQGGETLLTARIEPALTGESLAARVEAELLPALPGYRRLSGNVTAQLAQLTSPVLHDVHLELATPDLAQSFRELASRWPQLLPELPPGLPLAGSLEVAATLHGPARDPELALHLAFHPQAGGTVELRARGRPPRRQGEIEARVAELPLEGLNPQARGKLSALLHAEGTPEAYVASFQVAGEDVGFGALTVDGFSARGHTDGRLVDVEHFAAHRGSTVVEGQLAAPVAAPWDGAGASLRVAAPDFGVEEAILDARVEGGAVRLDVTGVATAAGPLWLSAWVPLGALEPWAGDALASWPGAKASGPFWLELAAPAFDTCALARVLPELDRPERVQGGGLLALQLDPNHPADALGHLEVRNLQVDTAEGTLLALPQADIFLQGGSVLLPPATATAQGIQVELAAQAHLAPLWRPEATLASLVESFQAHVRGQLLASRLQPFLAGGKAEGELSFEATASGTPKAPQVQVELSAPGAQFFWPSPYATRMEGVSGTVTVTAFGDVLLSAGATVNGGRLTVVGSRTRSGDSELQVALDRARFRLDLGLLVQVDADLTLELPASGERRLSGTVDLARALLDRPLSLEREVIPFFLAPPATPGTAGGLLDTIELDVAVKSRDGVRVRNNLADLRVRWDELFVRGTAFRPHLEGALRVEPGGLVRAYGQVLRIDRGVATFTGDPATDPRLDLAVTSSLEDPRIGAAEHGPFALFAEDSSLAGKTSAPNAAALAAGAAGGALAERLSQSLGGATRISVQPVLVFGEADPSARLTVSRPVSTWASFALSLDLRSAQRQTYLVDLHNLPGLASLSAQVFTNDAGNTGATVQQTLRWGAPSSKAATDGPHLARLVWDAPPGVPTRTLVRALGLSRGVPISQEIAGDLPLELEALLRQEGFPDARVSVEVKAIPGKKGRANVEIKVDPGAPVDVKFAGVAPPKGQRPYIAALYRSGLGEPQSLEDMREATVRTFRALGYLDPHVGVTVTPAKGGKPRTVTVHTTPGTRLASLATVTVPALPEDEQETVRRVFSGRVELLELASGLPSADRLLERTLQALGYAAPRVLGRQVTDDGRTLELSVELGPRQRITAVRIEGIEAQKEAELLSLAGLQPGQPARRDHVAAASVRLSAWFQARGHADARVRASLHPNPAAPTELEVVFHVDPGPAYTVSEVAVLGARQTSPRWAQKLAALPLGEPLVLERVREGRRRLFATGLFRSVSEETVRESGGSAKVRLHLEEDPAKSLAYGLRWEATQGFAAVVDFVDRHLLGRGLTFGLRGLYEKNEQTGKAYFAVPDIFGSGVRTEVFLEQRRRTTPGGPFAPDLVEDRTRLTFQLARPVGQGWTASFYGRWQKTHIFERTDFFPLDVTVTFPFAGVGLLYDSRNDRFLATRGVLASLDLSGTSPALGADLEFLRFYGQLAAFWPVGEVAGKSLTWAQSVRLGLARAGAGQELIRSERFFAGGEYSVRGYETDSIGPREELGSSSRPAGGAALLVLNQELRLELPFDLTAILFVDAGQVWAKTSQLGLTGLSWSTGLGIRSRTPLGLVRFDLAYPWQGPHHRFKVYFGFGSTF
ncbi:MAG: translocation/assembly module TamB domain-containing protein [Thermoanaerobaculum sp.]